MRNDLARSILGLTEGAGGARVVYGMATAANTVALEGAATAVVLPALSPVVAGDYCAVLVQGADRLILGAVGAAAFDPATINRALGVVAHSTVTTSFGPTTGAEIVFASVATVTGRIYRVTVDFPWLTHNTAQGSASASVREGTTDRNVLVRTVPAGHLFSFHVQYIFTGNGTTRTFAGRISTNAGSISGTGDGNIISSITIEDLGKPS